MATKASPKKKTTAAAKRSTTATKATVVKKKDVKKVAPKDVATSVTVKQSTPKVRNWVQPTPVQIIAELVGSFILVAVIVAALSGKFAPLAIYISPETILQYQAQGADLSGRVITATPLLAGFALAIVVLLVGRISAAHVNPAVTIGQMILRKTPVLVGVAYLVAQVLGGMLALLAVQSLGGIDKIATITPHLNPEWKLFFAEALGTFVFGFGVAAALYLAKNQLTKAVVIGGALTLGIGIASVAGIGVGFLNPAVALGAGIFHFDGAMDWASWGTIAIFTLGPIVGATAGLALAQYLSSEKHQKTQVS